MVSIHRNNFESAFTLAVEHVRSATKSRNPKILVVLVSQKSVSKLMAERNGRLEFGFHSAGLEACPPQFVEAAVVLRRRLELDSKQILLLQVRCRSVFDAPLSRCPPGVAWSAP